MNKLILFSSILLLSFTTHSAPKAKGKKNEPKENEVNLICKPITSPSAFKKFSITVKGEKVSGRFEFEKWFGYEPLKVSNEEDLKDDEFPLSVKEPRRLTTYDGTLYGLKFNAELEGDTGGFDVDISTDDEKTTAFVDVNSDGPRNRAMYSCENTK